MSLQDPHFPQSHPGGDLEPHGPLTVGEWDGDQGVGSHAGRLLSPLLADRLFYIKAGGGDLLF